MPQPPTELVSALAERYQIQREIGEGGMATVALGSYAGRRRAPRSLQPRVVVTSRARFVTVCFPSPAMVPSPQQPPDSRFQMIAAVVSRKAR